MGFVTLKKNLKAQPGQSLAVAWAVEPGVLLACQEALELGLLDEVILTGPALEIEEAAEKAQLDPAQFKIEETLSLKEGAAAAVRLVKEGRASLLMKGHLNTSILLRAVLNKEEGIRTQKLLSHIAVIELADKRLALLSDPAMNIKPDLSQKFQILDNAIQFAWSIGLSHPKVAVLASIETVNPQMLDTVDAAALAVMGKRGQFKKPALVDGPLAFDNAFSPEAAEKKGLESMVAGKADIFLVPEITSGNVLYKAFTYVGGLKTAGIIYGASCPIVLTSRADSPENKLNAIAIACQALAAD